MEPLWLGIAGPSLVSKLGHAAQKITQPFSAAMDRAQSLFEEEQATVSNESSVAAHDNPHTRLLSEVLTGHPLVGDQSVLRIDYIRIHADNLRDDLSQRIEAALAEAGIENTGEFRIGISPVDGSLEVRGDSPDRAAIENALAKDPTLAGDFRKLSALQSLVTAAEENSEFVEAYEQDPYAALETFGQSIRRTDEATVLRSEFATELRFDPLQINSL